jgi:hypothetical protein
VWRLQNRRTAEAIVNEVNEGAVLTKTWMDTTTQSAPYSANGSIREWRYTWQNSLLALVQSPRADEVEKTSYAYDSTAAMTVRR